jgi:hypothetical protein
MTEIPTRLAGDMLATAGMRAISRFDNLLPSTD